MDTPFVTVWSKHTGRPHRVPEHYLANPHLMRPFRMSPPADAAVSADPSTDWSLKDLRAYAEKRDVDLSGAGRNKATILERIAQAAHPTTVDPVTVPTNPPSDTASDGETPAAGE